MNDKNAPLRYILLVIIILTVLAVALGMLLSQP